MGKAKKTDPIVTFDIKHNNHIRKITTYAENKEGRQLKYKHNEILFKLNNLPSSNLSFAYKTNTCTKDALEVHKNSNMFIKMDIHDYFNSIKIDNLINRYRAILNICGINESELKLCFVDDKLPLGFITSPRISDLYLYYFDNNIEKFIKQNPNLKYSRYCDDIMISIDNSDFALLHTFESYIRKELKEFNLSINDSKRREFDLEKDTAVSFLGLNLSKKDGEPRITLSKTFLLWTLDLIEKFKNAKTNLDSLKKKLAIVKKESDTGKIDDIKTEIKHVYSRLKWLRKIILSRVSYIKFNSHVSYQRFLNKYKNKFNEAWNKKCLY